MSVGLILIITIVAAYLAAHILFDWLGRRFLPGRGAALGDRRRVRGGWSHRAHPVCIHGEYREQHQLAVERQHAWLGLVSQAGVAIGLATIVAQAYPQLGAQLRGMLLALIAVNETVGPILFRRALAQSGEIEAADSSTAPASSPAVSSV